MLKCFSRISGITILLSLLSISANVLIAEAVSAENCEAVCAQATESGFSTSGPADAPDQCCCMPNESGTIVSQPVEYCQVPQE